MENENKPKPYDLVLGGNNPPPTHGLVLGGIEGLKLQFNNANSDEKKIVVLKKVLLYGKTITNDHKINFQGVVFENLSLDRNQFYNIDFTGSKLIKTYLSHCNFIDVDFSFSNFLSYCCCIESS